MQLSRGLELLVLGLSAISVAEATFVNVNGVIRERKGIQQRQEDSDSSSAAGTTSAPPVETTSATEPTTTPETTRSTTSATPTQPPTTAPTRSSTSSPPSSSQQTTPSSTTDSDSSSQTEAPSSTSTTESSQEEPTTITIVTVWTSTAADGSQMTLTSQTVSTSTPGLADNGSSGQESGMSEKTRNTVIGVVVGVGGAIILGGLALVAWRIWGRKKHQEENDGLMDYGSTVEKPDSGGPGSMGGRTPFQSTLESYHAPTQVNTAANF